MKPKYILCVGIWILWLAGMGCDRRTPSNVLSKKEMTKVLADYHLARAMIGNLDHDQRYKAPLIIEGVYEKHGISKAIFDSSMVWYTRNPDDLAVIYGRVNAVLQERISAEESRGIELGGRKQLLTYTDPYPSGDSVDLWRSRPFLDMNRLFSSRKEQFIINTDTTFRPTDRIEWELHAEFLSRNQEAGKALMFLMIRYASDSVIISSRVIQKNGKYTLTIRNNSGLEMRQIWGFLQYFPGNPQAYQNRLWVDRIRLMRYRSSGSGSGGRDTIISVLPEGSIDSLASQMTGNLRDSLPVPAQSVPVNTPKDSVAIPRDSIRNRAIETRRNATASRRIVVEQESGKR